MAADNADPSLLQFEGASQSELSLLDDSPCFRPLQRVIQWRKTDHRLVSDQWHHLLNRSARRQLQCRDTPINADHLSTERLKIIDAAFPLTHQRRQRIGGGQGAVEALTQIVGNSTGQVAPLIFRAVAPGLLDKPD